ncbi:MAG TPA: nucleotidyltransferase domain-containing protein [Blastocatellia bacterium]|nr:nucleotidyltransferase domain-containing protein [Blastocatellia bacterium]
MDEELRRDDLGSAAGDPDGDRSILLTEQVTPRLIQYICEQIVRLASPQKIILFGSQARGDSQEGSDVDLLVIVNSPEDRRTATDRIRRFFMRRLFEMDVLVRTVEDVERNVLDHNPFYIHHILAQGKVLYERREAVPRS